MRIRFAMAGMVVFLSTGCTVPEGAKDLLEEIDSGDSTTLDTSLGADQDQDGFDADSDCDDLDGATYPGAPEICDGLDNDCDGAIDESVTSTWYQDADGDGFGTAEVTSEDCEVGQGYTDNSDDCNDLLAAIHPDAEEICDGADNDCDGAVDESDAGDARTWYEDSDGDGWGDDTRSEVGCNAPAGFVLHGGDCDDAQPSFHPGALEADCTDANDYNCDGSVGYADADADGYAACEDCDDNNAAANDAGTEVCDGADNDCDGTVDEPDATDATTWYGDADGDGYGGQQFQQDGCTSPPNFVSNASDCDDLDPATYPGASEVCDAADNDCDGTVDEGVQLTFYADADGDGYGDSAQTTASCSQPPGYSSNGDDCDDSEATTSPAALETCDGSDNDCDGETDEDDAINTSTWYLDADGDGYGVVTATAEGCDPPTGYAGNASDCNDADANIHPAASELCDSIDNDCDGTTDEPSATDASTWYTDGDGDGYGDLSTAENACTQPSGTVSDSDDCDDTDAAISPVASETCDNVDNNCDGVVDENGTADGTLFYEDGDGDGHGNAASTVVACAQPTGYVSSDDDCDDTDATISPSAAEDCNNNIDHDCNGFASCSSCGDSVLDSGEEVDPPPGPHSNVTLDSQTCRWDFSGINQLYCNGGCSWAGGSGCDQADADILCKLKTDNPSSTATSWTATTALNEHGFACPGNPTINVTDRGVNVPVYYQDASILGNHGAGSVIAYPVCTNP